MTQQANENTPEGREKRRQAKLCLEHSVKKTRSINGRTVSVNLGSGDAASIEVAEIDPMLLEVRQKIRLTPEAARQLAAGLNKAVKVAEVSSAVGKKY